MDQFEKALTEQMQHIIRLEKSLDDEKAKQANLKGQLDELEQFVAGNCVSVQSSKQLTWSESLKRAYTAEKSLIRNLSKSIERNLSTELINISDNISLPVETIQTDIANLKEKNKKVWRAMEHNMKRIEQVKSTVEKHGKAASK